MFKEIKKRLQAFIRTDVQSDTERVHTQYLLILETLGCVSFVMSVINIVTFWYRLAIITFIFSICCFADAHIERTGKNRRVGRLSFIFELIIVSTVLLIFGECEGFSPIWILLMPACGFFLFRMRHGLMITVSMLAIQIFLLWTPLGNSLLMYDYSVPFKTRFPIVFVAFSLVGGFFEIIRLRSKEDLEKTKKNYEYMYNHDALTGLYNRYGFNSSLDDYIRDRKKENFAFGIIDLDLFKNVNDKYGHDNGDVVLKEVAKRTIECVGDNGIVCRWGGEEFSILFFNSKIAEKCSKELMELARNKEIELKNDNIIQSFSMGLVTVPDGVDVDIAQLVKLADRSLYEAKDNGRNQIRMIEYYAPEEQK